MIPSNSGCSKKKEEKPTLNTSLSMGSLKSRDRVSEAEKKPWEMRLIPILYVKIPFTEGKKKRLDAALWYTILSNMHFVNVGIPLEISFLHDKLCNDKRSSMNVNTGAKSSEMHIY